MKIKRKVRIFVYISALILGILLLASHLFDPINKYFMPDQAPQEGQDMNTSIYSIGAIEFDDKYLHFVVTKRAYALYRETAEYSDELIQIDNNTDKNDIAILEVDQDGKIHIFTNLNIIDFQGNRVTYEVSNNKLVNMIYTILYLSSRNQPRSAVQIEIVI